jgi:hypothetical protein
MHKLSLRKRKKTQNKRKIFCEEIQNEWKSGTTVAKNNRK